MPSGATQSISDVSIALPSFSETLAVMSLQAGFNSSVVVIGTTLLGIAAGTIGCFALLRNRALMGDALAHASLPGLALAFIVGALSGIGGRHLWLLLLGATLSGVLGVACVQILSRNSRIHQDTAIGVVLSCFFGAGVVLMSIIQSLGTGEEGGLQHFIFGQTAAMNREDAYLTLVGALLSILICFSLFKEFRLICFDEEFASSDGWPVSAIDLVMMTLVVLVTVIGLQAVGLLLIVALLVIPPAGARFWTNKLRQMVFVSAAIGGFSGYIGSAASALLPRLPAGAVIVLVSGFIFFVSFLFAPTRGLLASLLSQLQMSLRITEDHLLREIYEVLEVRNEVRSPESAFLNLGQIPLCRSWSWPFRTYILARLRSQGLIEYRVESGDASLRLLPAGVDEAEKKVRNHRLWEEYLISHTEMPSSHVDYSADMVEHVLSADIVEKLEESLNKRLSSKTKQAPPASVHPLGSEA